MSSRVAAAALAAVMIARPVSASITVALPPPAGMESGSAAVVRESALVIWDRAGKREHLVLELQFAHSEAKLGYLIPLPTTPELAVLEKPPFAALETELPFDKERKSLVFTGQGWAKPKPGPGIELYSEQRLGTFVSSVFAASDETALTQWLAEQGLEASPALRAFRVRYAALGFQLVALRYDPASPPEPGMTSQTVRLSFATRAPYYPYFEPLQGKVSARRLSLWLVPGGDAMLPVAARDARWIRPLREGGRYRVGRFVVERAAPELASLLPPGVELNVQAFEDRKISREGIGDFVFVPEVEATPEDAGEDDRRVVAAWLDPRLSATPSVHVAPLAAPSVPTSPVAVTGSGCGMSRSGGGHAWLAVALLVALRRRWLVAVVALGCRRETSSPPPPARPAVSVAPPTFATAERMREVEAIARGAVPSGGIPVIAEEPDAGWEPPRTPSIMLDAVAEGALTRDVVIKVARANASRFRACYELGLRTLPTLSGKVTAFITISATGETERAKVIDNVPHGATVACFKGVFGSLVFAPSSPPAPSSATIELDLAPKS